jgi:SAM-dependent methyltransferase
VNPQRIVAAESRCPVCGSASARRSHAGQWFTECIACGYALLNDIGRADYWEDPREQAHRTYWQTAKLRYFDEALASLAGIAPGRRLLDVGGGIAFFSGRALSAGWDAYSLDVSPTVTEIAAETVGAERAWTSLPPEQAGTFDVVSLWCVVAHTDSPQAVLDVCRRALRPNGVLWLTTPNFSFQKPYAWLRRRLGNPLDFARDDHVGHFTPKAIRILLERGGFSDIAFNFCGITETCVATGSANSALVAAKRTWNRVGLFAQRYGLPNLMSELQATARLAAGPSART